MKNQITLKTVAQSDENCSHDSSKHSVKWHGATVSLPNGRETFTDLTEARIFMLDKACQLINDGYEVEIIPYVN
jgi:hypothetical protein